MAMKLPVIVGLLAVMIVVGAGLYVSNFTAYLGNDPATCNNCHVMETVYDGWSHSAHRNWAGCNDCHTPHALIPKYWVKAQSGYHHVTAFLFGEIPDAIRAKESSKQVIQENCLRCHAERVSNIDEGQMVGAGQAERYCFACHRSVAHGVRGISVSDDPNLEVRK